MKVIVCSSLLCSLLISYTYAQEKATTESGTRIIVYPDGTWQYDNQEEPLSFGGIQGHFRKPSNARARAKGNSNTFEVWYDATQWKQIKPSLVNKDAELAFQLKGEEGYAMLIYERVEIPVESLMQIAFENAQTVAPDAKVLENTAKTVNGTKIHSLRIEGSLNEASFTYFSYYYSDRKGSIQFTTFTSSNLFAEYRPFFEQLLNGLVIVD